MCDAEEDLSHVFSCNSEAASSTRQHVIYSIKTVLSENSSEFSEWWCTLIRGCLEALGALPSMETTIDHHHFKLR